MKIAIDISPMHSGHSGRGIGRYTKNLVEALRTYERAHTIIEFGQTQEIPKDADIVHYPYFDPFILTLPLMKPRPTVVTVHDLTPLMFPDKFPKGIRGTIKWWIQRFSLSHVNRIIADSNSSKKDIADVTGIRASLIDTVYLAPDPAFHPVVTSKIPLPTHYILYVGDVNWNKNVTGLIRAFANLRNRREYAQFKLVLVGRVFNENSLAQIQEINELIEQKGLTRSVIRTGNVSLEDLASLYSLASVYVQPSYYEGFGLPVLEAMACGCPVVSTNTSSLKEINGPAISVSPSAEDLAQGIARALAITRQVQAARQFEWVNQFTWKKTAQKTIQSYEKALGTL